MFSAETPAGHIEWDETTGFTGAPVLVSFVQAQIRSGEPVPTLVAGPFLAPADAPEMNAWYTARFLLDAVFGSDVTWNPPEPFDDPLLDAPDDVLT